MCYPDTYGPRPRQLNWGDASEMRSSGNSIQISSDFFRYFAKAWVELSSASSPKWLRTKELTGELVASHDVA